MRVQPVEEFKLKLHTAERLARVMNRTVRVENVSSAIYNTDSFYFWSCQHRLSQANIPSTNSGRHWQCMAREYPFEGSYGASQTL